MTDWVRLAEEVADNIIGTCMYGIECFLPEGVELDDAPLEFYQVFDEHAFCCDNCGWYCSTYEANDAEDGRGVLCGDCYCEEAEELEAEQEELARAEEE